MLYILLKFVWTVVCFVAVVFLCTYISRWLDKRHGKKVNYRIVYEYELFLLLKDEVSGFKFESWDRLKALGSEGWEIAQQLEDKEFYISYILKRETIHQS